MTYRRAYAITCRWLMVARLNKHPGDEARADRLFVQAMLLDYAMNMGAK